MSQLFSIIQIVISVLLIACVLLQQRGSGLSGLFGGGGGETYHTKRGLEKIISTATVVLVVLFLCLGVVRLILAV